MVTKPQIDTVTQETFPFRSYLGGNHTPAGSVIISGSADPDTTVVLIDWLNGGTTLSSTKSQMDGSWIFDFRDFVSTPLEAGLYDLIVKSFPVPAMSSAALETTSLLPMPHHRAVQGRLALPLPLF
jgi:hypothetical protein